MKQALIGFWSVVTFLKKKKRFTGGATSQKSFYGGSNSNKRIKSFKIKIHDQTQKKKKKEKRGTEKE